jgi:hypothetical protein
MCLVTSFCFLFALGFSLEAKPKVVRSVKPSCANPEISGTIDAVVCMSKDSVGKGERQFAIFTISGTRDKDTFELVNNDRMHTDWSYISSNIRSKNRIVFFAQKDADSHYFSVYAIKDFPQ